MSEKYIYLDWNVFKYIKKPRDGKFNDLDVEFAILVEKLSKKYKFPFSEGHLADLLVSYSEENKDKVDSDLDFISRVSNDLYVKVLSSGVEFHRIDPRKGFYQYQDEMKEIESEPISFSVLGSSYNIDTSELGENELLGGFVKENDGVLDAKTFIKFIRHIYENMDNPDCYNQMREDVLNLKENFAKRNTILEQSSECFLRALPLLDFIVETDENKIKNSLYKVGCYLSSMNGVKFEDKSLPEKVNVLYNALDFNISLKEKINGKNKPSNMRRDSLNLIHALHAQYYLTEDKKTKIKSEIVLHALSHKLKIMGLQEFIFRFD
ncbi:hypothetical protein [Aeromonas hydrophila]|uniref:hypothetical protein n=1 Tax=Aeromonas hydrophila TaxID=644 RepID=UPI000A3ED878|nr:hypothetical protein [Aeromonas hydrophila]QPR86227.1 hypothetical protein I6G73_11945 [Aeromonas hydrophila]UON51328.1 hypothetical protein IUJ49_11095 [Aeromonas hydrophila]